MAALSGKGFVNYSSFSCPEHFFLFRRLAVYSLKYYFSFDWIQFLIYHKVRNIIEPRMSAEVLGPALSSGLGTAKWD